MKQTAIQCIFTTAFLFTGSLVSGQQTVIRQSIYFETARYELTRVSLPVLKTFTDSAARYSNYNIVISGNTDDVGDTAYNRTLSRQRVEAVKQYFIAAGIDPSVFTTAALGETRPVTSNATPAGKQRNRRVDIALYTFATVAVDTTPAARPLAELYAFLENAPEEFVIDPAKDTILRCAQGTLLFIRARAFRQARPGPVTIKIKEDFRKSDMVLDNLSTTADNRLIETGGMIFTEAVDADDHKLNIINGREMTVMQPAQDKLPGAQIFSGSRNHSHLNWRLNPATAVNMYYLNEMNYCSDYYSRGAARDYTLWQRVCILFRGFWGLFPAPVRTAGTTSYAGTNCRILNELYKKYSIKNTTVLGYSLNHRLMDSLHVKTLRALQDTIAKIHRSEVEKGFANNSVSYEDAKYYVYGNVRGGWANVDAFMKLPPGQLVTMKIKVGADENTDCKIVFKKRKLIISPEGMSGDKFVFRGIPKNEGAWVVAIKYAGNKPYFAIKEIITGKETLEVSMQPATLAQLKEQLKVLNM